MIKGFGIIAVVSLAASPMTAQQPAPVAQPASGWVGITYSGTGQTDSDGNLVYHEYPVVVSVDPGSPAAKAGILAGDTIIAFNDRDLRRYALPIRSMIQPGKIFVLRARRATGDRVSRIVVAPRPNNRQEKLELALRSMEVEPPGVQMFVAPRAPQPMVNGIVGVSVPGVGIVTGGASAIIAGAEMRRLTNDLADMLGVKRQGLFVVNVAEGTPAMSSGLRGGDVLLRASSASLLSPHDLMKVMSESLDRDVMLEIVRKRKVQSISLRW